MKCRVACGDAALSPHHTSQASQLFTLTGFTALYSELSGAS
jgi:hypothetical protein